MAAEAGQEGLLADSRLLKADFVFYCASIPGGLALSVKMEGEKGLTGGFDLIHIFNKAKSLWKRETVGCIGGILALLSMAVVPPGPVYAGYIDLRVLCLLFCLMAVVLGLQECGLFHLLAQSLLAGKRRLRLLRVFLVLLPFFCSMAVTNDVALLTFVPFAVLVLSLIGKGRELPYVITLQTLAANLGSMATPVGNPQNLYLYAKYQLTAADFFRVMLPLTLASLLGLLAASLWGRSGGEWVQVSFQKREKLRHPGRLGVYAVLFVLCLLSVFRLLHYGILTAVVVASLLCISPGLLKRVDYGLLLTFVFFFIFAGNIGQMEGLRQLLDRLMKDGALVCSILASQVVSNVPAAVLLSGFTEDWTGLLMGVNIGGLGTPIASLASLISLKFYLRTEGARPLYYLAVFTLANLAGLALLLALAAVLPGM